MTAVTRSVASVSDGVLYVAFELGKQQWKLAMTSGFGVTPVLKSVAGGDWGAVERALTAGRQRLGVAASSRSDADSETRATPALHRAAQTRSLRRSPSPAAAAARHCPASPRPSPPPAAPRARRSARRLTAGGPAPGPSALAARATAARPPSRRGASTSPRRTARAAPPRPSPSNSAFD